MRHDRPDTVTASEIGEFVFCGESWRLAKTGHVAANQAERDRGAVEHAHLAVVEMAAGSSIAIGRVLIMVAMLAALLWAAIKWLG